MSELRELLKGRLDDVQVGDKGTLWWDNDNRGQGGTITVVNGDTFSIQGPMGDVTTVTGPSSWEPIELQEDHEEWRQKAWDDHDNKRPQCRNFPGPLEEESYALGWSEACRAVISDFDSDLEPTWFDETCAGEHWNEDY